MAVQINTHNVVLDKIGDYGRTIENGFRPYDYFARLGITGVPGYPTPAKILYTFGDIKFHADKFAPNEMTEGEVFNWAVTPLIGGYSGFEYLGRKPPVFTLTGVSLPHHGEHDRSVIDRLREVATKGEDRPLINGIGENFGQMVITSINLTHSRKYHDGRAQKINYSIGLMSISSHAARGASVDTSKTSSLISKAKDIISGEPQ